MDSNATLPLSHNSTRREGLVRTERSRAWGDRVLRTGKVYLPSFWYFHSSYRGTFLWLKLPSAHWFVGRPLEISAVPSWWHIWFLAKCSHAPIFFLSKHTGYFCSSGIATWEEQLNESSSVAENGQLWAWMVAIRYYGCGGCRDGDDCCNGSSYGSSSDHCGD